MIRYHISDENEDNKENDARVGNDDDINIDKLG